MRATPIAPAATRKLATALVAAMQRAETPGPVLRDAVAAALAQAFAPEDFQQLVAALNEQQRAVCASERQAQLAAALAGRAEGNLERARQAAEAAVRLDFANPEPHRVLAEILEQAGDGAAAHIEFVLAMHLGWGGPDVDAAIARTEPVPVPSDEGISPADRRFRHALQRAINCLESRDLREARRHARAAVALDPSRPEGFNLLGILSELGGRRNEARTQYLVASQLAPGYRPALENLAGSVRPWTERGRLAW
ncbi:MAG: hypothetical protein FIB01_11175 [Gemmatimonadetes bacterium]|nr:hypothetical protein [Gemmatimonadota bacterium]